MIYPTSRAVVMMAGGAPIALLIGLIQPGWWVAGAAWVALVGALCLVDAVLGSPRDRTSLVLEAPGAMPTAGVVPLSLKLSFERRPPAEAETAAQVNARLTLTPDREAVRVR